MSAVTHLLCLMTTLAGGVVNGIQTLERHPALGSLVRTLCLRVPNPAVRRAACAVLYRAAHWQELGRDASQLQDLPPSQDPVAMVAGAEATAAAVQCRTVAFASSSKSALAESQDGTRKANGSGLARVLFSRLQTDIGRVVHTIPFARGGPGRTGPPAGATQLSLSRPADATVAGALMAPAAGERGIIHGRERAGLLRVVDVPRLHLVEVTALVAGLVHVMLQQAEEQGTRRPPHERTQDDDNAGGAVVASNARRSLREETEGVGDSVKLDAGKTRSSEVLVEDAKLGESNATSTDGAAASAAEWLLGEATRRLAGHEFTETFK